MQATADLDLATPTATLAGPLEPSQDPGAVEGPPLGALGELTVPVAFELDTARVSLEELAAIGPGSVIDLQASAMDATVLLVCMGQVIGNGQLMVIGDRLGVRVTRMGADLQGRLWSRT